MPRKTADPHPESFFAFACWVLEQQEAAERVLPAYAAPDILRRAHGANFGQLPAWLLEDHAERHAHQEEIFRSLARDWLVEAGLDQSKLVTLDPACQQLVDFLARSLSLLGSAASAHNEEPAQILQEEVWRPQRRHIAEVISVVHVVLADQHDQRTADILNEGIPTKDRSKGRVLTRHNVRHHVAALGPKLEELAYQWATAELLLPGATQRAGSMLRTAGRLRNLWAQARAYPGSTDRGHKMEFRARALLDDGSIARVFRCDDDEPCESAVQKLAATLLRLVVETIDRKHGALAQDAA